MTGDVIILATFPVLPNLLKLFVWGEMLFKEKFLSDISVYLVTTW